MIQKINVLTGELDLLVALGRTPLREIVVLPGVYRFIVESPDHGYAELTRYITPRRHSYTLDAVLLPTAEVTGEMVLVPGCRFNFGVEGNPQPFHQHEVEVAAHEVETAALKVFDGAVPDEAPPAEGECPTCGTQMLCLTCGAQLQCQACKPPPDPPEDEEPGDLLQALRTILKVWREIAPAERLGLGNLINSSLAEIAGSDDGLGSQQSENGS